MPQFQKVASQAETNSTRKCVEQDQQTEEHRVESRCPYLTPVEKRSENHNIVYFQLCGEAHVVLVENCAIIVLIHALSKLQQDPPAGGIRLCPEITPRLRYIEKDQRVRLVGLNIVRWKFEDGY
ncbi:hypothetical protein LSAT2_013565 [Lamellibrachia satsuma]|nr:hypothetical protein LSAT2_013565 [Lamellibrachia satsuma]